MDELIRNLGPPVGLWLVALFGWLEVRHMHRKRPRPHRLRRRARHPSGRRMPD